MSYPSDQQKKNPKMFFVIKIAKDYIMNSTGKHYRYSITSLTKKKIFTDMRD